MSLPNILSKADFDKLKTNEQFFICDMKYIKVSKTKARCLSLGYESGEIAFDEKAIALKTALFQY